MIKEISADGIKAAPPLAVTGLQWFGISFADWVLMLTAIYTLLMILSLLRKMFFSQRMSDKDPACADDCPVAHRLVHDQQLRKDEASKWK